jgi:hypothetical protein
MQQVDAQLNLHKRKNNESLKEFDFLAHLKFKNNK